MKDSCSKTDQPLNIISIKFKCSICSHFITIINKNDSTLFQIQISKPAKASDVDEDDFDDSDEEQHAGKNRDGDIDAEEDDCENEESDMQFGVTPFLSGVLPAGRLTARTKPAGCQAYGLIQVRLKEMP